MDALGGSIAVAPGSPEALRVIEVLTAQGMWSQYLEVGLGPYPEVFTKAPVLSSVGPGSAIGIPSFSAWNNPEPELVGPGAAVRPPPQDRQVPGDRDHGRCDRQIRAARPGCGRPAGGRHGERIARPEPDGERLYLGCVAAHRPALTPWNPQDRDKRRGQRAVGSARPLDGRSRLAVARRGRSHAYPGLCQHSWHVSFRRRSRAHGGGTARRGLHRPEWDLPYARAWCARVEHLRPDWLEEPFPAAAVPSFAQLCSSTTIPLAAGEHLYDRYDLLPFLQKGLLSVVQVDPEWCGGVTEVVRMCAMAEPFGVQVFPHGHGIHAALHIVASQSPQLCPSVEYLYRFTPEKHYFEVEALVPKGGVIPLPTRPGFGIDIDEDRVETDKEVFAFS
nr:MULTISPECIES: enolase C-terminal domain-like protein [Streptomyces violaceusniger group]